MNDYYKSCTLCPRDCQIDRTKGEKGFCRGTDKMKVAYAGLHKGEEPSISGKNGSGTVFFSGCTLKCFFCQNKQISGENIGAEVAPRMLADIFLALQEVGAANINLVSGTHYIPGIIEAFQIARKEGLILPGVWNSSGYDKLESLELLRQDVSIFLPDMKTLNTTIEKNIFKAPKYRDHFKETLLYLKNTTDTQWNGDLLKEGVILRHLVLPGEMESTKEALLWYKENLYPDVILSLMFQYTPLNICPAEYPEFARPVSIEEYNMITAFGDEIGIHQGYFQKLDTKDHTWSPDFTKENPFSSKFSKPLWSQGKFL